MITLGSPPAGSVAAAAAALCRHAAELVAGDRAASHGDAAATFATIAALWSAYLGVAVSAADAAQMLALVKMARARHGRKLADHFIDQAGYAALAGALAAGGGE